MQSVGPEVLEYATYRLLSTNLEVCGAAYNSYIQPVYYMQGDVRQFSLALRDGNYDWARYTRELTYLWNRLSEYPFAYIALHRILVGVWSIIDCRQDSCFGEMIEVARMDQDSSDAEQYGVELGRRGGEGHRIAFQQYLRVPCKVSERDDRLPDGDRRPARGLSHGDHACKGWRLAWKRCVAWQVFSGA